MDQERRDRQSVEERLLSAEKKNSDLTVDLSQLQSQISALKADIRNENEKVKLNILVYLVSYMIDNQNQFNVSKKKDMDLN